MLSYVMNVPYNTGDGMMSPKRQPLLPLLSGTNLHQGSKKYDCILKIHANPTLINVRPHDAIVYIVRDGRDVANSYFHRIEKTWQYDKRTFQRVASRLRHFIPWRIRYWIITRYFALLWGRHVEEALAMGVPMVRYEDALENPQAEIESLVKVLDPDASVDASAKAVELFTLKNMQEAARQSKAGPVTDRVGRAGNWKEFFSPRDVKWFDRKYGDLMKRLSYS